MKIGTITFNRALNYGGILQCYALVKALRNLGYEAEVIDYRSKAIENTYKLLSLDSPRAFASSIFHFRTSYIKKINFRRFAKFFIPTSRRKYYITDDISNKYDFVFIGSDQIWSKRINHGFDKVYWGQFAGSKASYAASMGTDHCYTKEEYDVITKYLSSFNFISTREKSLKEELAPYCDKKIQIVADPTLLLSRSEYEKIAIAPKEDNYVLYYQMQYHPLSKTFVSNIAKQLGCKVVTIMGPNEDYDIEHIHKRVDQVGVQEFIGYILNAKCVIASSFHGTALPLAMKKDFYFLANSRIDRSKNLLLEVGAIERMKSSEELVKFQKVDYVSIEENLARLRNSSIDFIHNCIKNNR